MYQLCGIVDAFKSGITKIFTQFCENVKKSFPLTPDSFLGHSPRFYSKNVLYFSHIGCIFLLFSIMSFEMCPQSTCTRGCIVALVAFVWLFLTVSPVKMSPQITRLWKCKVTLTAFVRLFSAVPFQMLPQIACQRGCKVTLVAFVWLFPTVHFEMCRQIASQRRYIVSLFLENFHIHKGLFYPVLFPNCCFILTFGLQLIKE